MDEEQKKYQDSQGNSVSHESLRNDGGKLNEGIPSSGEDSALKQRNAGFENNDLNASAGQSSASRRKGAGEKSGAPARPKSSSARREESSPRRNTSSAKQGSSSASRNTSSARREGSSARREKPSARRDTSSPRRKRASGAAAGSRQTAGRREEGRTERSGRVRRSQQSRRRRIRRRTRRVLRIAIPVILVLVVVFLIFTGIKAVVRLLKPDKTPPVIELTRNPDYFVPSAEEYQEEGYKAVDDRDGDLTDSVRRIPSGNVICYEVTDRAGNTTIEYREVPVGDGKAASNTQSSDTQSEGDDSGKASEEAVTYTTDRINIDPGYVPDEKVIYLTFDDGPGEYTERLLEILDRYNVHVTFFVTGGFPAYADMIGKEYEAGHSIGVHSYTHDFAQIYADKKAFWADIEKMEKVVEEQTGHRTNLMRFAGGSSNTLSAMYTQGIMKELTKEAEKKGYHYFDWNVSSGDGSNDCTGQEVINNIINNVPDNDYSVVLCHDTKEFTVNNIEYVIAWALENGYTFLPLNETSTTAHHAVQN